LKRLNFYNPCTHWPLVGRGREGVGLDDLAWVREDMRSRASQDDRRIVPRITTTELVHQRELLLQARKTQGQTGLLPLVGVNIGFTQDGIQTLLSGVDVGDASFNSGARAQAGGEPLLRSVGLQHCPTGASDWKLPRIPNEPQS
jgi:hypothetical protein